MLLFTKMNGAGNDFVLIDNRLGNINLNRNLIARLCDRHRGIGADGILLLEKAQNRADFRMRYFNADGGEAEMCGNGARCFARFANKVAGAKSKISFETPAGVISADLEGDLVTLQMTEPTDLRLNVPLRVADENKNIHFINSGVPHVVIPVGQVDDVKVRREGAAIRRHEMFSPNGANINFIEKRGARFARTNVESKMKLSRAAPAWLRARSSSPQRKTSMGRLESLCVAATNFRSGLRKQECNLRT